MSDMKEKLVGIINNHCHDNYYTDPDGAAEAIIAALPDMVKPLEWARAHVWGADVKSLIYVLSESKSGHGWFVKFGGVIIRGADGATIFHETIMEAKAYAQSHHTALIISALGIETGGEG